MAWLTGQVAWAPSPLVGLCLITALGVRLWQEPKASAAHKAPTPSAEERDAELKVRSAA